MLDAIEQSMQEKVDQVMDDLSNHVEELKLTNLKV